MGDKLPTRGLESTRGLNTLKRLRRREFLERLRRISPADFNATEWTLILHRITSLATYGKEKPRLPSADVCTDNGQ